MKTWSEIKFDSKKVSFTERNQAGLTLYINIDAVRNYDESKSIGSDYLESLKTNQQYQV